MILTLDDSKHVDGRFNEYQYRTTVARTPLSEHFGCFKDNNHSYFSIVHSVFCRNDRDFNYIMEQWEKQATGILSMYSYERLNRVGLQSYSATQVLEKVYAEGNFKYLLNILTYGSIEIIQ